MLPSSFNTIIGNAMGLMGGTGNTANTNWPYGQQGSYISSWPQQVQQQAPVTPGMRASAKLGELFERIYNEFLKLDGVDDETLDLLEEAVYGEKLEPIVRETRRAQKQVVP